MILRWTDLWEAEVDGDSLWYVEEPGVAGEGDGEPVHGLKDVRSLVFFEHIHGQTATQWTPS